MRAVLDANIVISALLSPGGTPAQLLSAWVRGEFELIVSSQLLAELERALGYPKLRERITADEASAVVAWLDQAATVVADPVDPPSIRPSDADDEYLVALAESARAVIVSGDKHLLALADKAPIFSAAEFLQQLADV